MNHKLTPRLVGLHVHHFHLLRRLSHLEDIGTLSLITTVSIPIIPALRVIVQETLSLGHNKQLLCRQDIELHPHLIAIYHGQSAILRSAYFRILFVERSFCAG